MRGVFFSRWICFELFFSVIFFNVYLSFVFLVLCVSCFCVPASVKKKRRDLISLRRWGAHGLMYLLVLLFGIVFSQFVSFKFVNKSERRKSEVSPSASVYSLNSVSIFQLKSLLVVIPELFVSRSWFVVVVVFGSVAISLRQRQRGKWEEAKGFSRTSSLLLLLLLLIPLSFFRLYSWASIENGDLLFIPSLRKEFRRVFFPPGDVRE